MTIAPIYGCEGSLLSQSDETIIKGILKIPSQIDVYVYERPLSAIMENKQKIRYFDFIYSLKNKDCNEALKRIVPKIDLDKINKIIEETPCITDLQKEFYKTILRERKIRILDLAYEKLLK